MIGKTAGSLFAFALLASRAAVAAAREAEGVVSRAAAVDEDFGMR